MGDKQVKRRTFSLHVGLINRIRRHSLTFRVLLIFFLVISTATLIVSVTSYLQVMRILNQQNDQYARNVAESINREVDTKIQEMDRISRIILGNSNVQRIIDEAQTSGYTSIQRVNDSYEITNLILSFTSIQDSFMVQLYTRDLNLLYSGPVFLSADSTNLLKNDWYAQNKAIIDTQRMLVIPPDAVDQNFPVKLFGVVRSLQKIETGEVIGYITVVSDLQRANQTILQKYLFSSDVQIELVDERDDPLLITGGSPETAETIVQASRMVISNPSDLADWQTRITFPSSLNGEIFSARDVLSFLILISGSAIFSSLILAILLSNRVLKPIHTLTKTMESVRHGNFEIELEEKGLDYEVMQLYSVFNLMLRETRDLVRKLYEEKLLTRSAQLEALRYQINPHFLYNSLQTIEAVAEVNNIAEIQTIAQSLGKIFRYNIQGTSMVVLWDEIEQVSTYLNIEKIRHSGKIAWEIEIPEALEKQKVLKFILQPIVENCILHGFKSLKGMGRIHITATQEGDRLCLTISDNGRGMTTERLAIVEEKLSAISAHNVFETEGDYVGVFNVHKRIVNYHGSGFGLKYTSNESLGTTAIITLPLLSNGH